jgi:uncharacterized MAPEG superfamily protein
MSSEITILAVYALFTILLILVQVTAATGQVGIEMLVHPRDNMPKLTGLAGRLDRAQANSVVALALFAPAVLLLQARAGFTPATLFAAQVFLVARVVYAFFYAAGTPWVRTLSWLVAFFATAWLYIAAL